jgi:hypothetical protein
MAEPTTITLKEPIQFGSATIAELTFRKPKAKDFRRFPLQPTQGDLLDLVGQLTGQPKAVIDELGMEDMAEAMERVAVFMGSGRETGTDR